MASFRFIHTGDIHLDSALKGLSGHEGPAVERIRKASRTAFESLITHAIDEEVSFLVIAGDLYDGDWKDFRTGLFFVAQMGRLRAAGISAYVLYGNHDAESQITKRLPLPDNVHVFSGRKAETFKIETLRVALHGQSFRVPATTDNLAANYLKPVAGFFNIGVLHTALGGQSGPHENYAPCTLAELVSKGYDYWALAHVHTAGVLHENPHVVFCGNLQGRHVREIGAKSAQMITVEDGVLQSMEAVHTDVVRWQHLEVPVSECARFSDVIDEIKKLLAIATKTAEGRMLACRIHLVGATDLHGPLSASGTQLLAEARAVALALGEEVAWVLNVANETTPVGAASASDAGALNDLNVLLAQAKSDPELLAQIQDDLGELIRKIPHEVTVDVEDSLLQATADKNFVSVIEQAGAYLSARIGSGN